MKDNARNKGFSLVELAVVMTLAALAMSGMLASYTIYKNHKGKLETDGRIYQIGVALANYYSENQRYPCPAGRAIPLNDQDYGKASCIDGTIGFPADTNEASTVCNANMVCRALGARDVSEDGAYDSFTAPDGSILKLAIPDFENDYILIGDVPFSELDIPFNASTQDTYDGWGKKFTYAVTEDLTRYNADAAFATTGGIEDFREDKGVIQVTNVTADEKTSPPRSAHFVIISHGRDGKGAYTPAGVLSQPCVGGDIDNTENCDDDSSFRLAERKIGTTLEAWTSFTDDNNYADDIIGYKYSAIKKFWAQNISDNQQKDIINVSRGFIGINEPEPEYAIDVNGNIKANNIHADQYCDEDGNNCFTPNVIGGAGITCADLPMIGIANNDIVCGSPPPVASGITVALPFNCPANEYIYEIQAGVPLCRVQ